MAEHYQDPRCPKCAETMVLFEGDEELTWECPNGEGQLVNVANLYDNAQIDEIEAIWAAANAANRPGLRACPICDQKMRQVTVGVDNDEIIGNSTSSALTTLTLDVCVEDNAIWFDSGEQEQLPKPKAEASFSRFLGKLTGRFN